MDFSEALRFIKSGAKISRSGWNGKGMFAVLMPGYPEGIGINETTAQVLGLPAGDVRKFRPYFLLFTAQQDFAHWTPSGSDILAEDWEVLNG